MGERNYQRLFNPTEEHALLRKTVAEFARREVDPQAAEHDALGRLNVGLFRRLGELGLLGITIPAEDDGAGMDAVAAVVVRLGGLLRGAGVRSGVGVLDVASGGVLASDAGYAALAARARPANRDLRSGYLRFFCFR